MKGDFSRRTFDANKHYTQVLMQQGRVQLDADWNEQQAINQHRTQGENIDTVGLTGAPKETAGFRVSTEGNSISIGSGRYYVNGLLCENSEVRSLTDQPYAPGFSLPSANGIYLAYLKVSSRHITALEDPSIREIALGGPDTTTRCQTAWQVQLLPIATAEENPTCQSSFPEWDQLQQSLTSFGELSARSVRPPSTADELCILPPQAGYRGIENQLYRVEVHRGGDRATARFKWSRDNGSVTTALDFFPNIGLVDGNRIKVKSIGRDEVLGFAANQWVELSDDFLELNYNHGFLVQIATVDPDSLEITLKPETLPTAGTQTHEQWQTALTRWNSANADGRVLQQWHPTLRRWDMSSSSTDGIVLPASSNDWLPLEKGIEVQLSQGNYVTGDYWLIPARTSLLTGTGNLDWPIDKATQSPKFQRSQKSAVGLARLALIRKTSTERGDRFETLKKGDCRRLFPALTAITAHDVSFDPTNSLPELEKATTVQSAIDTLFKARQGNCTRVALPGKGWESILDTLENDQDAKICFQAGEYPLTKPITLTGKRHITIEGAGPATKIIAHTAESAFLFEGCKSVTVRNVAVYSGNVGIGKPIGSQGLNGTLTFDQCANVSISHTLVKCGAAPVHAGSCVTVRNGYQQPGNVRIIHSDFLVGHQQIGILLIDVMRTHIADNLIRTAKLPNSISLKSLLENKTYRAKVQKLLIRRARLGEERDKQDLQGMPNNLVDLSAGEGEKRSHVLFDTAENLVGVWDRFIEQNPPKGVQSDHSFYAHLKNVAGSVLINEGTAVASGSRFSGFESWYSDFAKAHRPCMSQGIVIGGIFAREVSIANNTIRTAQQGIHIGFSNSNNRNSSIQTLRSQLKQANELRQFQSRTFENIEQQLNALSGFPSTVTLNQQRQRLKIQQQVAQQQLKIADRQIETITKELQNLHTKAGTVGITQNNIGVYRTIPSQCHGIFVGNCDSLFIQDNYIRAVGRRYSSWEQGDSLSSAEKAPLIGIKIHGLLGKRAIVKQNHVDNQFSTGIEFSSQKSSSDSRQWIVGENVTTGALVSVSVINNSSSSIRGIDTNIA